MKKLFKNYESKKTLRKRVKELEMTNVNVPSIVSVQRDVVCLTQSVNVEEHMPIEYAKERICQGFANSIYEHVEWDLFDDTPRLGKLLQGKIFISIRK